MCSLESPSAPDSSVDSVPLERLEHQITELAAHINAATCRWLVLVGEYDRREGWAEWGCSSCTQWLSHQCGLSPSAAREHVRVGRLLADLPAIRETFGRGELCYSQVRAITRVATPTTEAQLVMIARHATAAQLELVVRAFRGVLEAELGERLPEHRSRYVHCEHDYDGDLLIRARLPAEEGALVLAALEAAREELRAAGGSAAGSRAAGGSAVGGSAAAGAGAGAASGGASAETTRIGDNGGSSAEASAAAAEADWSRPSAEDPHSEVPPSPLETPDAPAEVPPPPSNADALVLMAHTLLHHGAADTAAAETHQVVVHVDAATLAHDDDGACGLEHGPALHPETARRLACDASLVRILERDGRPLSVGRRTRSITPALRRALRSRDRICRFPGCSHRRFLHAHHVEHWASGGRTDLSNLIHLCAHHHRLVHEGGFTIERCQGGELRFRRPDGLAVAAVPRRPRSNMAELARRHREQGLAVDGETCVPVTYGDRLGLAWVVDGLAELDPRLAPV